MKPETIFDICHGVYCVLHQLHGWRIPSLTPGCDDAVRAQDSSQRPRMLPTLGDYLADFARCGERVLAPSRLILFRAYYLSGDDTQEQYERCRRMIGLSPEGWQRWTDEIRRQVGRELWRVQVYPPARYFREPLSR